MKQRSKKTQFPPESETVEWKQSLGEWKEIVETCAAFATAQGGTVYVGISPEGKRVGVQIGQGTIEDIANKIRINADPPQFPSIAISGPENSAVLKIHIEQNPVKPVWAFGRPMKRVGRTNQHLRRDESQRLLEISTGRTWDTFVCSEFIDKDISKKAVKEFLRRAGMKMSTSVEDVMRNLKLVTHSGFTNAAVLLFGKYPQRFFVEAQTKCARFKGTSSVHFLDERTLEGPILEQLDNAMAFVTRNTRQAIVITGRPERDIIPEYPDDAVREAITNALCHRNYAEVGTIQVRIYDNCLEVWNPGSLPNDISVSELYHKHRSCPRNMLLAGALFRARLIEHWGTGTLRIIEACKKHNIKVEFENKASTFIVRLKQRSQRVGSPTQSPTQSGDPVTRLLSALQTGELSSGELRNMLGIKHRPTFRQNYLHPALSSHLITLTIPDKPNSRLQKYRLTEKGKAMLS
ncbi:MAG: ATP-binding protein [Kiritimatiellae bacterium]|nr:ATP-binding protein [Kiritimatiellia bacterium]